MSYVVKNFSGEIVNCHKRRYSHWKENPHTAQVYTDSIGKNFCKRCKSINVGRGYKDKCRLVKHQ